MLFRVILSISSCALLLHFSAPIASAHSGGLNKCGSHFDRKNNTCHRHRGIGAAKCPCSSNSSNESSKISSKISGDISSEFFGEIGRIIDGDTLYVGGVKVRLHGIDSPEAEQTCRYERWSFALASTSTTTDGESDTPLWRCGEAASDGLRELLSGVDFLFCRVIDRDRWSRIIGRCFRSNRDTLDLDTMDLDNNDLGELLVRLGLAVDYSYYSGGRYRGVEDSARLAGLGIWRGCFTEPHAWRRGTRTCGE